MKKNWIKLAGVTALALAIGLGLAGCFFACDNWIAEAEEETPVPETPKYPREMLGEWVGWSIIPPHIISQKGYSTVIKTYQFYITSTAVYIDQSSGNGIITSEITKEVSISPAGSNGLILTWNGQDEGPWRLFPLRTSTAGFSGSIANLTSEERSVNRVPGGKGWANLVVTNLKDPAQTNTATTDAAGHFTVDGIIPGDTYEVTAEGKTVKVTPDADGDDIGTITLADGLNFKAFVGPLSKIRYAGYTYDCRITIENTGTETAVACIYQITGEEGESYSGIVGSIAPGEIQSIPFVARCRRATISAEKIFKRYNVVITDPINNRTWNDSVSLLFYKDTITFTSWVYDRRTIDPELGIRGVIISPEKISYPLSVVLTGSVEVPRLSGNYLIAMVNAYNKYNWGGNLHREVIYGIDVSLFPEHLTRKDFESQAGNFTDTGNYEPNNTEKTAQIIDRPIISYFHNGDIDYYLVKVD